MDLSKLQIPDAPRRTGHSTLLLVVLCLICIVIGFGGGIYQSKRLSSGTNKVKTAIAVASKAGGVRSFTAGGWVEAAVPQFPIVVSARVEERLEKLFVKQGDVVEPGSVLGLLYDGDFKIKLAALKARKETALKALELSKAGFRKEDIAAAEARVQEAREEIAVLESRITTAQERLRIAKANYDRVKDLPSSTISQQEVDNLLSVYSQTAKEIDSMTAELAKSRSSLQVAITEFDKMKAGTRSEEIAMAEAQLREFDAEIELANRQIEYCTLKAPDYAGKLRVLDIHVKLGTWIDLKDRSAILSLYDPNLMQARVDVTQPNIKKVTVGGEVIITADADKTRPYKGKVIRIEPQAELAKNTIRVRVAITEPDLFLFPDMTAQISFVAANDTETMAPTGVVIPSSAVVKEADAAYVFVIEGGKSIKKRVTVLGNSGESSVAVNDLSSGSRVIVSSSHPLVDGGNIIEE